VTWLKRNKPSTQYSTTTLSSVKYSLTSRSMRNSKVLSGRLRPPTCHSPKGCRAREWPRANTTLKNRPSPNRTWTKTCLTPRCRSGNVTRSGLKTRSWSWWTTGTKAQLFPFWKTYAKSRPPKTPWRSKCIPTTCNASWRKITSLTVRKWSALSINTFCKW